jgi:hypothetical protein
MKRTITLLATLLIGLLVAPTVLAKDWDRWFPGVWEATVPADQFGNRIHSKVTYKTNGSYEGFNLVTGPYGRVNIPQVGRWKIDQGGDESFMLTLTPSTNEPEASAYLEVIDDNTTYNRQDDYYSHRRGR